jgi:hypothetical protein
VSGYLALFPLAVLAGLAIVFILAIRLNRRVSRGTGSAGDLEPSRPEPVGQARTPWEVRAIDDQIRMLRHRSVTAPRHDLTATVNRLIAAAGLAADQQLPLDANREQLEAAVARMEHQLGLPPLSAGPSTS